MIFGLLAVLGCIVVWLGVYRLTVRHPLDIFALMLYLFAFMMIFRPLLFALQLDTPSPDRLFYTVDYQPLLVTGQLMTIAWLVCLVVGARMVRGYEPSLGRLLPQVHGAPHPRPFFLCVAAMTGLALLVTLVLVKRYGGIAEMTYAAKVDKNMAGQYILRQFGDMGCFLSAALALYLFYVRRARLYRVGGPWVLAALGMMVVNMGCVFAWGSRAAVAMSLLCLAFGIFLFVRRATALSVGLSIALFLAAVVGLRVARDHMLTGELTDAMTDGGPVRSFCVATNNIRYDAFMLMIKDWSRPSELRWGEDFFNGLAGVIPRSVWEGKPKNIAPGNWFRKTYDPNVKNGWPFTIVGEWYINFWYIGILVGGVLSGALYRVLQYVYSDFMTNPISFVFSIIMVKMVFELGFWTQAPIRYVLWCVPMLVVAYYLRMYAKLPRSQSRFIQHANDF